MTFDLLKSEHDRVVAVNSKVRGDFLFVGFLFVDKKTPQEITLTSPEGKTLRVNLPEEFVQQNHPKLLLEGELQILS